MEISSVDFKDLSSGTDDGLSVRRTRRIDAETERIESAKSIGSAPESTHNDSSADYLAPRTPLEATLAAIWAEVLSVERIGVRDDFFQLGGDSLRAVQAIGRIAEVIGLELSLYEMFESRTLEEVARRFTAASPSEAHILRADRSRPLPLSLAQLRLWFIDQLEAGSGAYYIPVGIRLNGALDRGALRRALDCLVSRHEALRTSFIKIAGEPIQGIAVETRFVLEEMDLRGLGVAQREAGVLKQSRDELAMPMDLCRGPLIRGRLLQLSEDEHVLLITVHHIVSDGWSIQLLIRELGALYAADVEGRSNPLRPLTVQYADYAKWQRQRLSAADLQGQLEYWKKHLQGAPELLELPTDRPRPAIQSYRGASAFISLETKFTRELSSFSRRLNLTVAMTLFAAWSITLSRISGQEDVVIGMPVANRRRPELENVVGFFVNTLALRIRLEDDPTVTSLLQRVREVMLGAYVNQDAPFEQVVEALRPVRALSHSPIFQAMFAMQVPSLGLMKLPGLMLREREIPSQTAQFDLLLALQQGTDGINGSLSYARDLFDSSTIDRLLGRFRTVLEEMIERPEVRLSGLQVMGGSERRLVVEQFNATHVVYPMGKVIHELFEEQVNRTPEAVALEYEERSLTYSELNRRANQLAWHLREHGVGPDQLVAICVDRAMEMVVALLSVLKAGGAYVALDPGYPPERVQYMLTDAAPRVVLCEERLRKGLPQTAARVIALDSDESEIARRPTDNLGARELGLRSDHLAYVIYTSGSTGRPKGVAIEHRNATNLIWWARYALGSPSVFEKTLQSTSLNFDLSVYECFVPLTTGGAVRVVQSALELVKSPAPVTLINAVPSAIAGILESSSIPDSTRVINLAGEELKRDLVERIFARSRVELVCNLYGPSETTTYSTWIPMRRKTGFCPSIGRPIANTQVYILDRRGQIVPVGVVGEIYIGGAGVARGYLNQAEMTAERFLPDPFSIDGRARIYKTGDLGRWSLDGTIEYLGRNDNQVKVRGFRIELGEIQAQLLRHEQIKDAAVLVREDVPGEKRLVGYVIPRESAETTTVLSVKGLRLHLKAVVPEYMVPSAFVLLERFPLTPNGKLDRTRLPIPELGAYVSRQYEAPRGQVEEILEGIWQELLNLERVGRYDNFFELGGHSLLIVRMMERLRRVGLAADVRRVFESPTLADLASALIRKTDGEFEVPPNLIPPGCEAITPQMLPLIRMEAEQIERVVKAVPGGAANIQDIYPLAPLQEGILFHHLLNQQGGDAYVVATLLSVTSRDRLDELTAALQAVIDRYDVLRTAVLWEHLPRPAQVVCRRAVLPVEVLALDRDRDPLEQLQERMRPERQRLDLRKAPLMRLQVAADSQGSQWYALLQLHHIVCDHETLEAIVAEAVALLELRTRVQQESLPYRNHVAQMLAYAGHRDTESFFRNKLGDVDEPTAPFGLLDVHGDGNQIDEAHEALPPELARRVRSQARRLSVSAATLFHAAWGLVVARTSGRDDVVFGTLLLGRFRGVAGAQRSLGMFINTLPLRLRIQGPTAQGLVELTQRELIDLLGHEQASLAMAQRCSGMAGSAPLFSGLLNYRHSVPDPAGMWSSAAGVRLLAVQERTNYPIAVAVDDLREGFTLTAQTNRRVAARRITAYLHTAMQSLVEALERAPQTPASSLSVLPEDERRQVIEGFNASQVASPRGQLIHVLFEEQASRAPDVVAVIYEDRSVTYAELNGKANQLARYLMERGVCSDQRVGLCVERGVDMVVGLLGILKAGGAYVPMDPNHPPERLTYMLNDAALSVMLTHALLKERLPQTSAEIIALDTDWIEIAARDIENLDSKALGQRSDHLAYVMYTSGSTGEPKGVEVEHRSVVNHRRALDRLYRKPFECRRIGVNAPFTFDASVQQFVQLLAGCTLLIVPQAVRTDPRLFLEFMERNRIEGIDTTPSQVGAWIAAGLLESGGRALRTVLVGGEAIDANLWNNLSSCHEINFYNVYGPTECTVDSTAAYLRDLALEPNIGVPLENTRIYILDGNRCEVPIGVTGELYIGGAGVARGYLNRPDLTAERFVADPFCTDGQGRLYRTGDLGRWLSNGTIEYLGRNDHQVKIRGFRIELGEIEARLTRHAQVKDAVVCAREDGPGERYLVAYVIGRDSHGADGVLNEESLREHLKLVLPEYMVPSRFVLLDGFPLTPNGKLDRRALPAPELGAGARRQYEAPQGEVEQILAGIWRGILRVERVGRESNFFELGGHSLLAIKTMSKVQESFGVTLSVADLYGNPRLRQLATRIGGSASVDRFVDLAQEAVLDHRIVAKDGSRSVAPNAILLTGATGFVGRFLLAQLLQETDATVYCLVRGRSFQQATSRLRAILSRWNLWKDEFERRIVVIPGDLGLPRLGLNEAVYRGLCEDIDTVYHCATSMNHLETYAMAKQTNVEGSRELLKLATREKQKSINYISTLSIFGRSGDRDHMVREFNEESSIEDVRHSTSRGYLASKWVGEKIFMTASERGIPCNIFRLGLVWADTRQGRYDELQREYRVFKSCLLSGYGIENYRYTMAPTPVDYVARAVIFLAGRHPDGQGVFHITSSHQKIESVFERCNAIAGTSLELMPLYSWIGEIKRLHHEGRSLPAVPLFEFAFSMDHESFDRYERGIDSELVRVDCARTHRELEHAGIVAPVLDDDLLRVYVENMISMDVELRELAVHKKPGSGKRKSA